MGLSWFSRYRLSVSQSCSFYNPQPLSIESSIGIWSSLFIAYLACSMFQCPLIHFAVLFIHISTEGFLRQWWRRTWPRWTLGVSLSSFLHIFRFMFYLIMWFSPLKSVVNVFPFSNLVVLPRSNYISNIAKRNHALAIVTSVTHLHLPSSSILGQRSEVRPRRSAATYLNLIKQSTAERC